MNSSFRGMTLKDREASHMHLGAIINPRSDLNRLVSPMHLVQDVVENVPGVRNRGDTPSNDAEVGHLDPGTNELALLESSWAAMAKQRESEQNGWERPLESHTNQVTEPDGIIEGSYVHKKSQTVESL